MSMVFCRGCGNKVHETAITCPSCGAPQTYNQASAPKSQTVAGLWCFFLGAFGAHRFYLGNILLGILYLIFFWTYIPALIALFDLMLIAFTPSDKWDAKYNGGISTKPVHGSIKVLACIVPLLFVLIILAIAVPAYHDYVERANQQIQLQKDRGNAENPHASQGYSDGIPELQTHSLDIGVQMPFPGKPMVIGTFERAGSQVTTYSLPLENKGIFFSASVMAKPTLISEMPQRILEAMLSAVAEGSGAEVLTQEVTEVYGNPARITTARIDQFDLEVIIRTVGIYDQGRVHSWSIQEIVSMSGGIGENIFLRNIEKIITPERAN